MSARTGDAPSYRFPRGAPRVCAVWPCVINKFGAYECWSHANSTTGASRAWNAAVKRHGVLVLDHPPKLRQPTPLPSWATRYPHEQGYIIPWTKTGQLRSGLMLRRTRERAWCSVDSEEASSTLALRCGTNLLIYDPCFAHQSRGKEAPVFAETPGVLVACATAPGSRMFVGLVTKASP